MKMTSKENDMFFKIIKDIEESDEQQVSYDEEFQLSKYAYVINNAETFKEMGYQVINKESVFGFDTVYLKRNKKVDDLPFAIPQQKIGHWITQHVVSTGHFFTMIICSNCREEFSYDAETGVSMDCYDYCPNCGLKMEGSE